MAHTTTHRRTEPCDILSQLLQFRVLVRQHLSRRSTDKSPDNIAAKAHSRNGGSSHTHSDVPARTPPRPPKTFPAHPSGRSTTTTRQTIAQRPGGTSPGNFPEIATHKKHSHGTFIARACACCDCSRSDSREAYNRYSCSSFVTCSLASCVSCRVEAVSWRATASCVVDDSCPRPRRHASHTRDANKHQQVTALQAAIGAGCNRDTRQHRGSRHYPAIGGYQLRKTQMKFPTSAVRRCVHASWSYQSVNLFLQVNNLVQ